MSQESLVSVGEVLREAAASAAWRQWGAIFTIAPSDRPARAIVDPEALLLVSMVLAGHEPRLWRVSRLWAKSGVRLLSVQRTKNILRTFDGGIDTQLAEFATIAVSQGNDGRWHALARTGLSGKSSRGEPAATPKLASSAALMLRLRLGLGVGIKADVLAYLVGIAGGNATIQQISGATCYYSRAVRRAVEELAAAGFIETLSTAPASYRASLEDWQRVMEIDVDDPPAWRPWAKVYAFVTEVSRWLEHSIPNSETVAASEARDISTKHQEVLDAAGVRQTRPEQYPGAAFLEHFARALAKCAEYLKAVV